MPPDSCTSPGRGWLVMPARTFRIVVNMPPISTGPNGNRCQSSLGSVFLGRPSPSCCHAVSRPLPCSGKDAADLLSSSAAGCFHADHVRDLVTHGVHRVVRLVAVEMPESPSTLVTISTVRVDPDRRPRCVSGRRAGFGTTPPSVPTSLEGVAVDVDRMIVHPLIGFRTKAHALALNLPTDPSPAARGC